MTSFKRAAYIVLTILALGNGWWGLLYFQTTETIRVLWAVGMWFSACVFLAYAMTLEPNHLAELEAEYRERQANGETANYPE